MKRSAREAAAAALEADKARMQMEGLVQQKQTAAAELASAVGEVESATARLAHEKVVLQGVESTLLERGEEVLGVEREVRRAQARLEAEEKRVHEKKQELSSLEHKVREAHTLLAQTYDSMHVERARALKELEQLEGAKAEAQHAVHRARLVSPPHALRQPEPDRVVPSNVSVVAPRVKVARAEYQHENFVPQHSTTASASATTAPVPPLLDGQTDDTSAKPPLFGDVSGLRSSVERLRAQSRAVLS